MHVDEASNLLSLAGPLNLILQSSVCGLRDVVDRLIEDPQSGGDALLHVPQPLAHNLLLRLRQLPVDPLDHGIEVGRHLVNLPRQTRRLQLVVGHLLLRGGRQIVQEGRQVVYGLGRRVSPFDVGFYLCPQIGEIDLQSRKEKKMFFLPELFRKLN